MVGTMPPPRLISAALPSTTSATVHNLSLHPGLAEMYVCVIYREVSNDRRLEPAAVRGLGLHDCAALLGQRRLTLNVPNFRAYSLVHLTGASQLDPCVASSFCTCLFPYNVYTTSVWSDMQSKDI